MAGKKVAKKVTKKVKRLPIEKMHSINERDPNNQNYTRGGKWLGAEK